MRIVLFSQDNTTITFSNLVSSFIRRSRRFLSSKSQLKREGDSYSYLEISLSKVSKEELFYSAFGTPGRYLMEMYTKMAPRKDDGLLLFNPFFKFDRETASIVIESVDTSSSSLQLISDKSGTPLGYFFPFDLPEGEIRYLSLISCMNAELDAKFLELCMQQPGRSVRLVDLRLRKSTSANGFNYNQYFERIYRWVTESAIRTLENIQSSTDSRDTFISARDTTPFTAIMPHHAGDVLFMALAFNQVPSYVSRAIVNKRYVEILKEVAPQVSPVEIDLVPTLRQGCQKPDEEYFWDVISAVQTVDHCGSFFQFWRPSREYRISNFHLIDHFAFAMGASFDTECIFPSRARTIGLSMSGDPQKPSILLHFEGGWPLKTYPFECQKQLILQLLENNLTLTILTDKPYPDKRVHTVPYQSLAQFRELLRGHSIFVGVDSFPVHYAAHVAGSPAICMFGNTKPVNSDTPLSEHYTFLCNSMGCYGCFGFDRCPNNSSSYCDNFPAPNVVLDAAEKMLCNIYGVRT